MIKTHLSLVLVDSFLQSKYTPQTQKQLNCHNPYFNRWISAIMKAISERIALEKSQSLF